MYILKKQLSINLNIMLECEHDTTKEEAQKELDKLLDSVTLLTDYKLIFSQTGLEKIEFKDVTSID